MGRNTVPTGPRPSRADIFSSMQIKYKLALNVLGIAIFASFFGLTARRGATDPVCGMQVDRAKAITKQFDGQTFYFSTHCRHAFEADPERYLHEGVPAPAGMHRPRTPTTDTHRTQSQ